ncbi:transcriptional regulator [Kaistia sp. 32K]|nr:transcriptional regulator [Kaistia sp. 32K]
MARAALGWSAGDLASRAGVPEETVLRFESGELVAPRVDAVFRGVFEALGLIFEADGQMLEGGPGVRLGRLQTDEGKRPEELSSANDD